MQFIHHGFSKTEIMTFKDMVQHNVLAGIKELSVCARESNVHAETLMHLLRYFSEIEPLELGWYKDRTLPEKVRHLWEDPTIQEVYKTLGFSRYKKGEHAKEEDNKLQALLSDSKKSKKEKKSSSMEGISRNQKLHKAKKSSSQSHDDKKDTDTNRSFPDTSSHQDSRDEETVISRKSPTTKSKKERFPFRSHESSTSKEQDEVLPSFETEPELVATSATSYIQNLSYFIAHLDRISGEDYVPTLMDILKVRQRTTGAKVTRFVKDSTEYQLVDVGGQSPERLKWEKIAETLHPTAILFFLSMDEYDVLSEEDPTKSKLDKAIEVFITFFGAMGEEALKQLTVVLFLNKKDLFEERIQNEESFARFRGKFGVGEERDVEECERRLKDYVVDSASSLFDEDKEIHCHVTCALDTEAMRAVFEAVKQDIFMNRLIGCRTNIV